MLLIAKIGNIWKFYGFVLKYIYFYGEMKDLVDIIGMFKEDVFMYLWNLKKLLLNYYFF